MANELTVSASLSFVKGNTNVSMSKNGLQVTVSGSQYIRNVQSINHAAEEAIQMGELASLTPGYSFWRNNDSTNFVELRPATSVADFAKMKAGEIALFRFADGMTAPYGQADTAAVEVEYIIVED